jgi:hypothetical protein
MVSLLPLSRHEKAPLKGKLEKYAMHFHCLGLALCGIEWSTCEKAIGWRSFASGTRGDTSFIEVDKGARGHVSYKGRSSNEKLRLNPLSYIPKQPPKCKSPTPLKYVNKQMTVLYDIVPMLWNVPLTFLNALNWYSSMLHWHFSILR